MSYCVHCGNKIVEGGNFCAFCGQKVGEANIVRNPLESHNQQRKQQYIGKVFKCPHCGDVVTESSVRCSACGAEITGKEVNETIRNFSEQLMKLENQRLQEKINIKETIVNAFLNPTSRVSKVDSQIISLIKTFPIPNNIEEIAEFMYLAAGNIDINLSKNTFLNNSPGVRQQGGSQREISDAWVGKLQQIYAKAERVFPNEPIFMQLRDIYNEKMKQLRMKVR